MTKSDTRERIVQAVRSLHEEVGPAATTITAIAERAGVQRLTVYRHFPDDRALIGACSTDWADDHPLPDPAAWAGMQEPEDRLEAALAALYGYYRDGRPMLAQVLRDEGEVPELAEVMAPWWEYMREVAAGLAAGWGVPLEAQRHVRAAVGHALGFGTWRSLVGEGLTEAEAVELMVGWIRGIAGS
ncbi:MAG TPA: TetR/AcrR family transcriptional regulator [Longimicrobiales bacterium]|nr:TetR/AcrR family transcriptional regulator [Longimicrobiales bacterium]